MLTADDGPFVSDDECGGSSSHPLGILRGATDDSLGIVVHNGVRTSAPLAGSGTVSCDNITAVLAVQADGVMQCRETASALSGEKVISCLYIVTCCQCCRHCFLKVY